MRSPALYSAPRRADATEPGTKASVVSGAGFSSKVVGAGLLNLVATLHAVWFYLSYVPSYLHLEIYEAGLEKMPFQGRMLMMFALRWAHRSLWMNHAAAKLTSMPAWFPRGVRPEGLIEAPVDLLSIVIAGLVARSIYLAASRRKLVTFLVYPLTLLMATATYSLLTMHWLRFVYDLPSLGFFSVGMYLIYFRRSALLFCGLFMVATVNRETTLFLLPLYLLAECGRNSEMQGLGQTRIWWAGLRTSKPWAVVILLLLYWIGWHEWVVRHFAENHSVTHSRVWLNVGTLLWPTSWPQMLSVFAFCGPLVLWYRGAVLDETLRLWRWIVPLWFLFMFRYGILIETRIFGELIPYMACMTALITEERIAANVEGSQVQVEAA